MNKSDTTVLTGHKRRFDSIESNSDHRPVVLTLNSVYYESFNINTTIIGITAITPRDPLDMSSSNHNNVSASAYYPRP